MKSPILKDRLASFDGKHVDILEEILSSVNPTKSVINELISLTADPDYKTQSGSTWLLKNWAETGLEFTSAQLKALLATLPDITFWEAKLHICQMLQNIRIPKECDRILVWFLDRNLQDENKYLRAWTYSGFYELSLQFPEYNDHVRQILDEGETEKAAAVKARIRNIRKQMNRQPARRN